MTAGSPSPAAYYSAYAALYFIWGSTYLAIRFTVETIPPFLGGALRFFFAGGILMAWCLFRGEERPTLKGYGEAFKVSGLMLLGGYGGLVWAQQTVPSSLAALIVSIEPLWFVLLDWLYFKSRKPSFTEAAGLVLGFGGTVFLVLSQSGHALSLERGNTFGMVVILLSNLSWSMGALCSRKASIAGSGFLGAAMQMTSGGLLLLLVSMGTGETARLAKQPVSLKSAAALAYLVIFGSLMGFTSFMWLLKVDRASRVVTHTFVNPIVAIFLGWAAGGESVSPPMLAAASVIILSVVLITRGHPDEASAGSEGSG